MSLAQAAYALDPALWCVEALGLEPDPWQAEVLRSDAKRILLNCSRQSGKSTITAALALHTTIFQPGSLVLCLSPTYARAVSYSVMSPGSTGWTLPDLRGQRAP
jgi:hypothetical protein